MLCKQHQASILGDLRFLSIVMILVGVGGIVAVMGFVALVAQFRTIEVSGWEAFSQIVPWFAAYFGGYLFYRWLPIYVTHGQTRREFYKQAAIVIATFASLIAIIITVGYLVEYGVYSFADWQRAAPEDHLFSTFRDGRLIFVDYWLTMLVWTVAGSLIGAAWYRSEALGVLSLIPALALVSAMDIAVGAPFGGPFNVLDRISLADSPDLGIAVIVCAASLAIGAWLIWEIVSEVPIRNR